MPEQKRVLGYPDTQEVRAHFRGDLQRLGEKRLQETETAIENLLGTTLKIAAKLNAPKDKRNRQLADEGAGAAI